MLGAVYSQGHTRATATASRPIWEGRRPSVCSCLKKVAVCGWDDPAGKVQLALFTSFILGAVCGYKTKG